MSDFDALQAAIRRRATERQAEARACEALLGALYHALRTAGGPGLPLNNVALDPVPDPSATLRPPPLGGTHAAWIRLGLCEVFVRVRREGGAFLGEYGPGFSFRLDDLSEEALTALARRMLRDLTAVYAGMAAGGGALN
ncbi:MULTISPECIES: hypothetical protein [Deinococcus]|uniref:hypothetical protein n=1 Tax=Deinococcus TaxID=1298 RepID=UPI000481211D|nr:MULTISPECIES: hypothetical protein [Deinococcus]KEF34411.1 hypothetical protein RDMS_07115 [Deinococcus sp. RL]